MLSIKKLCCLICSLFFVAVSILAQRVIYAEPTSTQLHDLNEIELLKYEIIGNYGGNILIYKRFRKGEVIGVYNPEMKEIDRVTLDFLPSEILNVDFVAYPNFFWMFYSFQAQNNIYSMAVKLGSDGKMVGQPIQLDKSEAKNKIGVKWFTLLKSQDKQRLMLIKLEVVNENQSLIKTLLFDDGLKLLHASRLSFPLADNEALSEFALSNDGVLVFGKSVHESVNDGVAEFYLLKKMSYADDIKADTIKLNFLLDDVKIKIDNLNKKYMLTSFYFNEYKDGIKGLFHAVCDWQPSKGFIFESNPLDGLLQLKTKAENDVKSNINNFYLQHTIVKNDGGLLVTAENIYYSFFANNARSNVFHPDRVRPLSTLPYRYNADEIVVFSFDQTGKLKWSKILNKSQFADAVDGGKKVISYQLINTGDGLNFFYNNFQNHPVVLNNQLLDVAGNLSQIYTPRGINKKYVLLPRFGKQTDLKEMVVPCLYRNFLTFAKIIL